MASSIELIWRGLLGGLRIVVNMIGFVYSPRLALRKGGSEARDWTGNTRLWNKGGLVMVTPLLDVLTVDTVVVSTSWDSFDKTVEGLVDQLVAAGRVRPELRDGAIRSVCAREAASSTAMVDIGVSIPHARVEGVEDIVAALAVMGNGVYQWSDSLPISIVVLVLTSPRFSTEHLTFLSSLSMLLQSERIRQYLKEAVSPREVMLLLQEYAR